MASAGEKRNNSGALAGGKWREKEKSLPECSKWVLCTAPFLCLFNVPTDNVDRDIRLKSSFILLLYFFEERKEIL